MGSTFHGSVNAPGSMFGGRGIVINTPTPNEGVAGEAHTTPRVGIVTALPEERAAVITVLDGPHRLSADEATAYDGGSLPSRRPGTPHTVVLTTLVGGGNDNAATAFTNLVRSFPSVKYVVMCGIAAGVPNPSEPHRHVRLGDIVVASWGIVEYDHVDQMVDGPVLRTAPARPSTVLLGADRRLESGELRGLRPWENTLRLVALERFARPDARTDVIHDEDGRVVPHPADQPQIGPKVLRGLIGSADRSLRDARFRDRVARQHGLLAIEMEGKGIGSAAFLNARQWFVVRGVSDYGDSRTSRIWRPYAALAAASYVRALLAECEPVV